MNEERKQIEDKKEMIYKMIYKSMDNLEKMLTSNVSKEDYLMFKDSFGDTFEIMPSSTSFEIGNTKLNSPFFLLMKDVEFEESVSIALTLEQAIQLRDFLNEKIEIIKNIEK